MTCENCIHNELIKTEASSFCLCSRAFEMTERRKYDPNIECEYFIDRSKVLYLPCKIGDTVYTISRGSIIPIAEADTLYKKMCKAVYKEGIKDFAEALKFVWYDNRYDSPDIDFEYFIDTIAEEMVGETK